MNIETRRNLFSILTLSALLLFSHIIALKLYLYWTTWWADLINHFLGGAILVLIFSLIFPTLNRLPSYTRFGALFALVFASGVAWEMFELGFHLTFVSDNEYLKDTSIDLVMDMLGMTSSYQYFLKKAK
ncbi:MAG TPA: hypothetical protein VEC13_02445 [Candidatus Paceibacterota bacterium]|nr:hypothetical protein [Candidatus Paceibacterota bacterium]